MSLPFAKQNSNYLNGDWIIVNGNSVSMYGNAIDVSGNVN